MIGSFCKGFIFGSVAALVFCQFGRFDGDLNRIDHAQSPRVGVTDRHWLSLLCMN